MQEYAEAQTLLNLVEKNRFIAPEKLNVSAVVYVFGLADVIGELRRQALDSLRAGDLKRAEHCLRVMKQIYVELMSMNEAYMHVGYSRLRLSFKNMPSHLEIRDFAVKLAKEIGYNLLKEAPESRVVLLSSLEKPIKLA